VGLRVSGEGRGTPQVQCARSGAGSETAADLSLSYSNPAIMRQMRVQVCCYLLVLTRSGQRAARRVRAQRAPRAVGVVVACPNPEASRRRGASRAARPGARRYGLGVGSGDTDSVTFLWKVAS
jgi:hypothetical protein